VVREGNLITSRLQNDLHMFRVKISRVVRHTPGRRPSRDDACRIDATSNRGGN
jgi:hypothetical protein